MSQNEMLYSEAMEAVRRLFSDTSVPPDETRQNLQGLRDEIDVMLESLPD